MPRHHKSQLARKALEPLKRSLARRAFDRVARGVLETPPLRTVGDSPLYLSLLCHRDLTPYLLAIKSLYRQVGHGRVAVISDGSLTESDLGILHYHLGGVEVFERASIVTPPCPRADFFWERIVKLVALSSENYVIQVDADTLTVGAAPEVIDCWRNNRSFLLGTGSGRSISSVAMTARMVRGWIGENSWTDLAVGTEAEASLDRLPNAANRSYVHASAGFAGFARGAFRMEDLQWFSTHMSEILGTQRWQEWGSEQIASNYLIANSPGAQVLPFPRYACFEPHLQLGEHAFLHFLGEYRYDRGVYKQRAAEFIINYKDLLGSYASPASSGTS